MPKILPTDSEAADGIGSWSTDASADYAPVFPENMSQLASFELDRQARENRHYLSKLLSHRDSTHARINGSIGCTAIVPVGAS